MIFFILINTIIITFLNFIFHNIYKNNHKFIFSLIFPVNESIFEHMKLIIISIITNYLMLYFSLIIFNLKNVNIFSCILISIIVGIATFLILFLPYYYKNGDNFKLTILFLVISTLVSQYFSYKVLFNNNILLNKISFIFIILILCLNIYFTYKPIKNNFFKDPLDNKYGIK